MADPIKVKEWLVAELNDLDEPGACEFRVGEGDWPFRGLIVRWEGGVYAYTNSCAHLGHPLNFDPDRFFTADKEFLICASHGALFEPATGLCVAGPCMGARLNKLVCRVDGNSIYAQAPDTMR